MSDIWESVFHEHQVVWGLQPTSSAVLAASRFAQAGLVDVLIPGVGYGRNAQAFLALGMKVTGIEISATAIALSRSALGLDIPIHHGSVEQMPFDDTIYDGVFCYALIHLLDAAARAKLISDCAAQLAPGGMMIFSLISKSAPMYARGKKLGDSWYETSPGIQMYFFDRTSAEQAFGGYGELEFVDVDESIGAGVVLPFINVICRKTRTP